MKVPQNEDELIPPEDVLETVKEKIGRYRRMYNDEKFIIYMNGYDVTELSSHLSRDGTAVHPDGIFQISGHTVERANDLVQGQVILMHDREDEERYIGR